MVDFQPPFDGQLEKEILSTMLFDPSCIVDVADLIKPDLFYHSTHQKLCEEIYRLWNEDESRVNQVELIPFLEKNDLSVEFLVGLMPESLPSAKTIRFHGERLKAIALLRHAVQVGRQLIGLQGLKDKDEIREALNQAEIRLSRITSATAQVETMRELKEVLLEVNEEVEENMKNGGGIIGLPTGFEEADEITGGFKKKDLIIIAGRPSMGKSAFALQIGQYLRNHEKKNGIIFNLEMDRKSMAYRLIANWGLLDLLKVRSAVIDNKEYQKYVDTLTDLSSNGGKLFLDEQAGMMVSEMKAKARKVQREHGLDYIIVDYLGLIRGSKSYMNRVDEVSENSALLKAMAKELDVPVISLCQLSREVERRMDKRPALSDLRESGAIEQDADLVMFLYRDEYYNSDTPEKGIAECIIAKHRNGPTGKFKLLFTKEYNLFSSLERGKKA